MKEAQMNLTSVNIVDREHKLLGTAMLLHEAPEYLGTSEMLVLVRIDVGRFHWSNQKDLEGALGNVLVWVQSVESFMFFGTFRTCEPIKDPKRTLASIARRLASYLVSVKNDPF
jgi:hypothetical protein